MASPARSDKGFTRLELLVVVAVIVVLAILAGLAAASHSIAQGQLIYCLNNTHQIHIATMIMVQDGIADKNPSLGWPGDLKTQGSIATVGDFVNVLVRNDYLTTSDLMLFGKIPGFTSYQGNLIPKDRNGKLVPAFSEKNNAFKVFLVTKDDPDETLFLTTKNYTYNTPLNDPNAKPFGNKGFVVVHKGGDASIFKKQQAKNLQIVGKLPGGGSVESAENCLNPGKAAP